MTGDADELLEELRAAVTAERRRPELVVQLRQLGVTFEVIRDRAGVPTGTAHRWAKQYETQTTGEEQGMTDEASEPRVSGDQFLEGMRLLAEAAESHRHEWARDEAERHHGTER